MLAASLLRDKKCPSSLSPRDAGELLVTAFTTEYLYVPWLIEETAFRVRGLEVPRDMLVRLLKYGPIEAHLSVSLHLKKLEPYVTKQERQPDKRRTSVKR